MANPFHVLIALLRFRRECADARKRVNQARGDDTAKAELAAALRALGELERRMPFTQRAALKHYEEAVSLYRELDDPLKLAHTIRHLGLVHDDARRLKDAERNYDEALAIYRAHATGDTLDYANTVRYPAAIKERLGKTEDSASLWEEACRRYEGVGIFAGVAEAAGRLTLFSLAKDDLDGARAWFEKARAAAAESNDVETDKFIAEIAAKLHDRYRSK
jgi:tetratricopeptide (TPR) repeat protein